MPLTQAEMDEADDLFVSLAFGSGHEKAQARSALEQWAGQDPARLQYLATHEAVDREVDSHSADLRRQYVRHVEAVAQPSGTMAGRRAATWGASAVVLGALVTAAWVVNPVLSSQSFSSAIGEQADVELDDGSRVLLNTDTAGVFENRLRSREVRLQHGEALFSVVHGRLRPFAVLAGDASVRDIGTRFSVRTVPAGVVVAVLEGRVELALAGAAAPVTLDANQAARTDGTQIVAIPGSQPVEALVSWKDRRLQFDGTPLADVVRELQRYRKTTIVLADANAAAYRVTGGFSSVDPDLLLKTLPGVVPVTVRFQQDGTAVIASRR
ncbi:FecR family protein [Paraburkholderia caballeronis]|uniref:FecR family protein n=2 Tax=Paraburkholderia caballeronis TaxID=416943 RepID=A0A1H7TFS0_9BURK|nr:FecR family protein [Paraburkholderia caballeronis]PXW95608.1 FecR family protein [Paraburkholderia caballeronis]RAJ91954.1 FecR family protein [Paraburkholderia caballeronis]SEB81765.1 FecR family protein [Paraburkholderia caballeronis]SEL83166.1 FecR family protein [Paraburkholderia caballeronis]